MQLGTNIFSFLAENYSRREDQHHSQDTTLIRQLKCQHGVSDELIRLWWQKVKGYTDLTIIQLWPVWFLWWKVTHTSCSSNFCLNLFSSERKLTNFPFIHLSKHLTIRLSHFCQGIISTPYRNICIVHTNFHLESRTNWVNVTSCMSHFYQLYTSKTPEWIYITSGSIIYLDSCIKWLHYESGQTCCPDIMIILCHIFVREKMLNVNFCFELEK